MSTSEPPSRFDPPQAEPQNRVELTPSNPVNTTSWRSRELSLAHVPGGLPTSIQQPKYAIGDRCRWIPTTTTDWGTIIGQIYAPVGLAQAVAEWSWLYLILLDSNSPSSRWVTTDWAEEDDLEKFPPPM